MENYESTLSQGPDTSEFEALLNEGFDATKPGELIEGKVIAIGRDYVIVDIGYKSEGQIPISQFQDHEGKLNCTVGDTVEVLLLSSENEDGEIVLSRDRAEQLKTWNVLEQKFGDTEVVKGRIVQKVHGIP